jgi:hypothetical protein
MKKKTLAGRKENLKLVPPFSSEQSGLFLSAKASGGASNLGGSMVDRKCIICGIGFKTWPSRLKLANRGKYCSRKCFMVGQSKNYTMEKNPNWKGGRKSMNGYIQIRTSKNVYEFEHRIIMEEKIGRKLSSNEYVHHINGIKTDNRITNLLLYKGRGKHDKFHAHHQFRCPTCGQRTSYAIGLHNRG